MSLSAREAIAFLQQFVEDHNSPGFYVIPETFPAATTEAVSFMESCWSSALRDPSKPPTEKSNNNRSCSSKNNNNNNNNTAGACRSPAAPGSCSTRPLPDVSPRNASVVYCGTPSAVNPLTRSKNMENSEGFFSTAVVPVQPEMNNSAHIGVSRMPKESRSVSMGVISAAPLQAASTKLKFATQVTTLGKTSTRKASKKGEQECGLKTGGSQNGMVFNKGFGQHILKNPLVIAAIVEKAAIKSTDVVLEIGPGTGNLTEKLLQTAKRVIAFEVDPRMVAELNKRFQNTPLASKLQVIRGNCLDHEFPFFDKCVANVPYAISSPLVFKLLKKPTFKCAVLMFQREFALRVCAQPGSEAYCRLSVNSQLLARCSHLMKISKNSFNPPPKVESSVIRLDPKHPPPDVDFEEWDGLVKFIFNRKNKKVSSIFRTKNAVQTLYEKYCSYQKMEGVTEVKSLVEFKELLESVLQHPVFEKRARGLDLATITDLLCHFTTNGIHFV